MSGFYNNWIKTNYPNMSNDIAQMKSGGFQAPFYLGGSQVPSSLGISNMSGGAIYTPSEFSPVNKGKTIQSTNIDKKSNILLPRFLKRA